MISRENIKVWLRDHIESSYHPSCTLPMGTVTDEGGKMIGLEGLRVCDASIMPKIISGNLNASVIMMAEKIADGILCY